MKLSLYLSPSLSLLPSLSLSLSLSDNFGVAEHCVPGIDSLCV